MESPFYILYSWYDEGMKLKVFFSILETCFLRIEYVSPRQMRRLSSVSVLKIAFKKHISVKGKNT